MSASFASRRAANTWQRENSAQRVPVQLSRVEVMRSRSGCPSGRSGSSARSPDTVCSAQFATRVASTASLGRAPVRAAAATSARDTGSSRVPSAARRIRRGPGRRASSGRSRWNSWSCSVRVPVETRIRRPDSSAGTRYANVLPVPVPASTTSWPRSAKARSTASAMRCWPARGRNPGNALASGPSASKSSSSEIIAASYRPRCLAARVKRANRVDFPEYCVAP